MKIGSNLVGPASLDSVTLSASRLEETGTLSSVTCKVACLLASHRRKIGAECHKAYQESKAL